MFHSSSGIKYLFKALVRFQFKNLIGKLLENFDVRHDTPNEFLLAAFVL